MMFRKRIFNSAVSIFALLLILSTASGCYASGTADMPEYISRFPEVCIAPWGLDATESIPMSDMVGDENSTGNEDVSELTRQVEDNTYRMFWVNVADAEGGYPASSVSEVAFYLACTEWEGKTVSFKIFKSSAVPTAPIFNLSDITDSENNTLYQDGQIVDNLPNSIDVIAAGEAVLKEEWTDIYVKLNKTVKLNSGERLVIYICENNDSRVSVTRRASSFETTENTGFPVYLRDSSGVLTTEQKTNSSGDLLYYRALYGYQFYRYPDNDISFSIDKVLLYVNE